MVLLSITTILAIISQYYKRRLRVRLSRPFRLIARLLLTIPTTHISAVMCAHNSPSPVHRPRDIPGPGLGGVFGADLFPPEFQFSRALDVRQGSRHELE